MDILRQAYMIVSMGPLMVTFILGFTSILLFLWYSSRNLDYWKKRGVPYVKSYPFFGSILDNMKKPLHDVELDRYKKYGRIYGHFEFSQPLLSVADVEILLNIFVKDFHAFTERREVKMGHKITESMTAVLQGEEWKRVRSIVSQAFSTGKIRRMTGILKECSKILVNNFKRAAEKGEPIDAGSAYSAFTIDVIASSAFSTKVDTHNDPKNKFVVAARDFIGTTLSGRFLLLGLFPSIVKCFKVSMFSTKTLKYFSGVIRKVLEERKKTGQRRDDVIQLLIDTAQEVPEEDKLGLKDAVNNITENYGSDESDVVFKNSLSKKSLSHEEIVGNCIMFFVAGYDSVFATLAFASYLLAINPDIQEKLIQELDDVLADNNGELTYEALQSMKYLDNVIWETLRLYPAAIRLERKADEDYMLADTGIKISKGMIVTVPTYAIFRDPEYFAEPEKFSPDRFTPEERAKRHPYTFLPFGAGPRNCIGMRFAMMEMKVCLAHVLSNFRLKKCSQTKETLNFGIGDFLLRPKDIKLQLEVRTDAVKSL